MQDDLYSIAALVFGYSASGRVHHSMNSVMVFMKTDKLKLENQLKRGRQEQQTAKAASH